MNALAVTTTAMNLRISGESQWPADEQVCGRATTLALALRRESQHATWSGWLEAQAPSVFAIWTASCHGATANDRRIPSASLRARYRDYRAGSDTVA
jgi:hypothetical protein